MRKRLLATLLSLVMVVSLVPISALAAEPCTKTDGCILEAGHEGECVTTPDEPEPPADGDENDYYETNAVTGGENGIMLLADTTQSMSGTCGATDNDNVTWALTQNNGDSEESTYTLTISGSGAMQGYTGTTYEKRPWQTYCDSITKIVVEGTVELGTMAFRKMEKVETAVLNSGIEAIPNHLFLNCTALETVELPQTLKYIGDYAFQWSGLTSITLPKKIELGAGVFWMCYNLTTVSMPDNANMKSMKSDFIFNQTGNQSFNNIQNFVLTNSDAPSLKMIDNVLYSIDGSTLVGYVKSMAGSYKIPDGVKTIGNCAFYGADISLSLIHI